MLRSVYYLTLRQIMFLVFGWGSAFYWLGIPQNHPCDGQLTKQQGKNSSHDSAPSEEVRSTHVIGTRSSLFSRHGAILHSSLPDNEVHIPFFMRDNYILVKAMVAGKPVDCMIDTGTNAIVWPKSLGLKGKRSAKTATYRWMAGRTQYGRAVRLPSIRIGDFELKAKPTLCIKAHSKIMILGTLAFQEVVLTIDWNQKQLILRSPHYTTRTITPDKTHLVTDFVWRDANDDCRGVPVFALTIEGHPAHCLLDTGNPVIDLKPAFAKKYLRSMKRVRGTVTPGILGSSTQNIDCIPRVTFEFAGLRSHGIACFRMDLSDDYDGSYGNIIYKYFRTTIDYPHKRLLFEPYSVTAKSTQHKESSN